MVSFLKSLFKKISLCDNGVSKTYLTMDYLESFENNFLYSPVKPSSLVQNQLVDSSQKTEFKSKFRI